MRPGVGDEAPDFTLPGTQGPGERRTHTLREHRGSPVVLVFYPADASPVCTVQLRTYTRDIARFEEVGATVLALSPQGIEAHERFADAEGGFAFPLLADEDKAVGAAYGVLGPLGFYRRSVVVVDPRGRVAWVHRSVPGLGFRTVREIVEAVEAAREG
jgi:peroxiredoxin